MTCPVTAGWLMHRRSAARVKLPSRATASKARSWKRFMVSAWLMAGIGTNNLNDSSAALTLCLQASLEPRRGTTARTAKPDPVSLADSRRGNEHEHCRTRTHPADPRSADHLLPYPSGDDGRLGLLGQRFQRTHRQRLPAPAEDRRRRRQPHLRTVAGQRHLRRGSGDRHPGAARRQGPGVDQRCLRQAPGEDLRGPATALQHLRDRRERADHRR